MLFTQKVESMHAINERLLDYKKNKKRRAVKKWDKSYPIYEATQYLDNLDLLNLLLVNKEWRKRLTKRVYRVILDRTSNTLTKKQRKAIWIALLSPVTPTVLFIITAKS